MMHLVVHLTEQVNEPLLYLTIFASKLPDWPKPKLILLGSKCQNPKPEKPPYEEPHSGASLRDRLTAPPGGGTFTDISSNSGCRTFRDIRLGDIFSE